MKISTLKFNTRWIIAVLLLTCIASASSAASFEVEPGISLYYSDEGKGTPILFVPGWTMNSEVFARQLAADALFSDYRPELEKLSQEIPTLYVLGEEDAAIAKPWLIQNAPKAKIEVLGRHMMF
jgi:pimeloyl-ACP methyl ester carboxylesterase